MDIAYDLLGFIWMTDSSTSFAVFQTQLMSQQGLLLQEIRPAFYARFALPVAAQHM